MTDESPSYKNGSNLGKEPDVWAIQLIQALPDALVAPRDGRGELADLVGAKIVQIGTAAPGLFEGGGLLIDYLRPGNGTLCRIVLAFSERGMWVEHQQSSSS